MVITKKKVVVEPGEAKRVRLSCWQRDDVVLVRVGRDLVSETGVRWAGICGAAKWALGSVEKLVKSLAD